MKVGKEKKRLRLMFHHSVDSNHQLQRTGIESYGKN